MLLAKLENKYRLNMQVSARPMARIGEALWPKKSGIARPILAKLWAMKSIRNR
jgi:hypothetical protein